MVAAGNGDRRPVGARRLRRLVPLALAMVLLVGSGALSPAQAVTHSWTIEGKVSDAMGSLVQGARVSDGYQAVLTDATGYYTLEYEEPFVEVPLTVTKTGFEPAKRTVSWDEDSSDVDFGLAYGLSALPSPIIFSPPETLTITARSHAPALDSCVIWYDHSSGSEVPLELDEPASDGENTWSGTFDVAAGTTDGSHDWSARVEHCGTGTVLSVISQSHYVVDAESPVLSVRSPSEWSASSTVLEVEAVEETTRIEPSSVTVELDGTVLDHALHAASDAPALVRARAEDLAAGSHQATVSLSDYAGNHATVTWTFSVDPDSPTISETDPTGSVDDPSPEISASLGDDASGLSASSISMTLKGAVLQSRLDHSFDPETGRVSYQVPDSIQGIRLGEFPLPPGNYEVVLTVTDQVHNRTTTTWTFTVNSPTLHDN